MVTALNNLSKPLSVTFILSRCSVISSSVPDYADNNTSASARNWASRIMATTSLLAGETRLCSFYILSNLRLMPLAISVAASHNMLLPHDVIVLNIGHQFDFR